MSSIESSFHRHAEPVAAAVPLEAPPQLASWDAAGSSSQVRLTGFLDSFQRTYRSLEAPNGPLVLQLNVARPPGSSLLTDFDLDNYLTPVCARLKAEELVSVWATKFHGTTSTVRVEAARPLPNERGWQFVSASPKGSASNADWKASLRVQVGQKASLAPDGALELQVSFRVGASRQWQNLWKQTIDALGAVLGYDDESRPFDVRDGRIVRLGLHRTVAPDVGHDVSVGIWWRMAEGVLDDEIRRPRRPAQRRPALASPTDASRRPASTSAAADATASIGIFEFRHDDAGYLRWTAANPQGYVINTTPSYSATYLMLHRATCRTVTELRAGYSRWTTGDYIKVCSLAREELVRWAKEKAGGTLRTGCYCRP